ncbi:SusC/RagA family TonB-linked outer membrane protein [Solitalea longa]|nr:SusC/RagA family TonB-linked outer membrane protein [Solitalea longa]
MKNCYEEIINIKNNLKSGFKRGALLTLLFLAFSISSMANAMQNVSLNVKNVQLSTALNALQKQVKLYIVYTNEEVNALPKVTLKVKDQPLDKVLDQLLNGSGLDFTLKSNTIVIGPKQSKASTSKSQEKVLISGTVEDENKQPLFKASVSEVGTNNGTFTDEKGHFELKVAPNAELNITYLGMVPQRVSVAGKTNFSITMKVAKVTINEVVVTGTGINRNKNSFTGSTVTISGNQLKAVGNNNILQSLRTLDPSFIMVENNIAGANPNVLPNIEIRGKTSVPSSSLKDQFALDPNQPLFILDGFETTLQTIVDLDMNRVGSVTILKDAASTALYGARASNGVVVVETIKPKAGKMNFTYSNDFRVETPDLSDYNMMNATEKLEFERLSGRYTPIFVDPDQQVYLEQLYNDHLGMVKQGVNTYWLNEPVQTGFSHNTSVFAQGGDDALRYGVGVNYKSQSGAMKGSGRDSWSGNINLTYRKSKFNINNIVYVRGYSSTESPYGSFSNFVNTNPYYTKDASQRYLEQSRTASAIGLVVRNPLFDASLPNKNASDNLEVQNNLLINYALRPELELRGGLQVIKGAVNSEVFLAPENSQFEGVSSLQKGRYSNNKVDNFSYQANVLLNYGKVFNEKHSLTANARAEISTNDVRATAYEAEGFPEGSTGNPRFAYSYVNNSAPSASLRVYRTVNATLSANYVYDSRYLFDASYRLDGSTAFGSNKQFSPYWSTGIGWNLHNESFLKGSDKIDRLKLFANIGVTGNQNFGSVSSVSVFDYNTNTSYNQFGQGLSLSALGNPDLAPQKTTQISGGLDYALFNNRLSGSISVYNKYTSSLVVPVDLPSSTGVLAYPMNVGNLNTNGLEVRVNYSPINNYQKRFVWTVNVTGSLYKSKYEGFGNSLGSTNKQQELSSSLIRFKDGYSPDAIWAVRSLGIDPATGRELFLTADGRSSFDFDPTQVQAVGNTAPTVEGIFGNNVAYKGFNLGINLRYRLGGDIFNSALYNKVENISYTSISLNQDKRALYERWKNPGDVTKFKAISQTSLTPMSSRFVQEENTLACESITLGYTFERSEWMKQIGMSSLNLSAIGNEVFRISTVKRERGIDYPFAQTVSFSLRASF